MTPRSSSTHRPGQTALRSARRARVLDRGCGGGLVATLLLALAAGCAGDRSARPSTPTALDQPGRGQPGPGQPGPGQPGSGQPGSGQPAPGPARPGQPVPGRAAPASLDTTVPAGTGPLLPADGNTAGQRASVLGAYDRFWTVASTLDGRPRPDWRPVLAAVAADPVLSSLLAGLDAQLAGGQQQYGEVRTRPSVVSLGRDRAAVVDCQDASRSGLTDTGTGLPATVGSPRTPVAATLVRDAFGVWRVAQARYLSGTC